MKLSTSSTLFAFSALTANNSALISANNNGESSLPTPTMAPSANFAASSLAQLGLDPSGGHLSLLGLDPSIPLTKDEAAFLESTLRKVFNSVYKEEGIDLVTGHISIAEKFVSNEDVDDASSNLRGSNRKLLWTDRERCWHDPFGPLKGQIIEDCDYDIEFYLDGFHCDLCDDDIWTWTPYDYYGDNYDPDATQEPILSDDVFYQFLDDDYYEQYHRKPSTKPIPVPDPTAAPTVAPTESEDDEIDVEMERGPQEPYIDPISMQILFDLQHSPFSTFHHVTRVSFGGW